MLDLEKKLVDNNISVSIIKKRFAEPKTTTVEPYGDLSKKILLCLIFPVI